MKALSVLLIATLAAPAALAADGAKKEGGKKEKVVCKTVDRTGTRMRAGTICKKESQWRNDETAGDGDKLDLVREFGGTSQTNDGPSR